jgi:hypothetical protein
MEIGAFGFLFLASLGILWTENTKTGARFIEWFSKQIGIDLDDYPEE